MTARHLRGPQEAGFALLDALVAVALLAAVTALVPTMVVQARRMVEASGQTFHTSLAADLIVSDRLFDPPHVGRESGRSHGHQWEETTRVLQGPAEGNARSLALYSRLLTLKLQGGRDVRVETLVLGPVQ